MRMLRYFLHVLQLGMVYGIFLMDDLYKNHLGFMRNASFYSHKLEASMFGSMLFLLPIVLLLIAILIASRKKTIESLLLVLLGIVILIWQMVFTIETIPIFYLVSGFMCLIFLLQLIIALLKRSPSDGLLKRNN